MKLFKLLNVFILFLFNESHTSVLSKSFKASWVMPRKSRPMIAFRFRFRWVLNTTKRLSDGEVDSGVKHSWHRFSNTFVFFHVRESRKNIFRASQDKFPSTTRRTRCDSWCVFISIDWYDVSVMRERQVSLDDSRAFSRDSHERISLRLFLALTGIHAHQIRRMNTLNQGNESIAHTVVLPMSFLFLSMS